MNAMHETNTTAMKSWWLAARPEPDENKLHPWGMLLGLLNASLFFLTLMLIAGGIGVADEYPLAAQQMLLPFNWSIFLPLLLTIPAFALLAVRGYFKSRLGYYACTGLLLGCTAVSLAVVLPHLYTMVYIGLHF